MAPTGTTHRSTFKMSRPTSHRSPSTPTSSVHPALIRAGLGLALLTALSAFAVRAGAQVAITSSALEIRPITSAMTQLAPNVIRAPSRTSVVFAAAPFAVGEELTYKATLGGIPAGSARMRVD